jgi:hypothetical protein
MRDKKLIHMLDMDTYIYVQEKKLSYINICIAVFSSVRISN